MKKNKLGAAVIVLTLGFTTVVRPQTTDARRWTPPTPRKAETPFAPKPVPVHNIFKGDADVWLADAIEKLECGGPFDAIDDVVISNYVSEIGKHVAKYSVAPKKTYRFIVTDDSDTRAMTAGGGRIYVSLGMLKLLDNEDELAGILAHEIAHDAFHHAARMVTRQMFWLTETREIRTSEEAEAALAELNDALDNPLIAGGDRLLGFARFDELEADRAAFYNTYKAGYNPQGLTSSLKKLQRQKDEIRDDDGPSKLFLLLFGSHPLTGQRAFALSWESNFVKMPPENLFYTSPGFDEMKRRIEQLEEDNK